MVFDDGRRLSSSGRNQHCAGVLWSTAPSERKALPAFCRDDQRYSESEDGLETKPAGSLVASFQLDT